MTNYRSILKQEAAIAREEGKVRFIPSKNAICKIHNSEHYTASSRCCECTKLSKVPAKQAAYWQTIKHEISAKRKLKAASPSQ